VSALDGVSAGPTILASGDGLGLGGGLRCCAMLTTVGLALDIIGAFLLLRGLFRAPRPLAPGWAYSPLDAATDMAYGTIGGLFLGVGFVGQILGNGAPALPLARTVAVSVVVLIAGAVLAYVLFGVSVILAISGVQPWVARQPGMKELRTRWVWRPRLRKFWRYEGP
jgi:hypothetical protein